MKQLSRTSLFWYWLQKTIMGVCEGQHGVHEKRVLTFVSLGNT